MTNQARSPTSKSLISQQSTSPSSSCTSGRESRGVLPVDGRCTRQCATVHGCYCAARAAARASQVVGQRAPSVNATLIALLLSAATIVLCAPVRALPPRGSEAPVIRLKDLGGRPVNTKDFAPRAVVLVFGELGHEGVKRTCSEVLDVLADPRIERGSAVPVLVVAQEGDPAKLRDEAAQGRYPPVILHDPAREAFGAYRILVVPSVVVVDGQGKVTYAMPGFLSRFREILTGAVLTATGRQTSEKLDETVNGTESPNMTAEDVRAARLVRLAGELVRHGLYEMAEERYSEALALVPASIEAKQGLADLMLLRRRLDDAAVIYRSVLAAHPDSGEAMLGLAEIDVEKGAPENLDRAEKSVRDVLARGISIGRARYLLGRILERRGDAPAAMAEYRAAAETLLRR